MLDVDDTIVGIASAAGGGIRGVLRPSGPRVLDCLRGCLELPADFETQLAADGLPRMAPATMILEANLGRLPGDLYIWPTQRSYTRQPSGEFHTLGSPPLLEAAVRTLVAQGARLAGPGEFTMRAFLAGRLDLTQAEAVLGVIDARDQHDLDVALTQLAGGLATPLHQVRAQLLELLAHLEAGLDFVEEDIEFISAADLRRQIDEGLATMRQLMGQMAARDGGDSAPKVVLYGPPNAGKSSLFNALAGEGSAIVSETPGTTRDYLACALRIDGQAISLIDTAGWEAATASGRSIAAQAQAMTQQQHGGADLVLDCRDVAQAAGSIDHAVPSSNCPSRLLVWTKCDRPEQEPNAYGICTSAFTGRGLAELRSAIGHWYRETMASGTTAVPATITRCQVALRAAEAALRSAAALTETGSGEELVAVEVRAALDQLGQIVGVVYTDDLLDKIFSRFCIGK